jgi:hypothetical protein
MSLKSLLLLIVQNTVVHVPPAVTLKNLCTLCLCVVSGFHNKYWLRLPGVCFVLIGTLGVMGYFIHNWGFYLIRANDWWSKLFSFGYRLLLCRLKCVLCLLYAHAYWPKQDGLLTRWLHRIMHMAVFCQVLCLKIAMSKCLLWVVVLKVYRSDVETVWPRTVWWPQKCLHKIPQNIMLRDIMWPKLVKRPLEVQQENPTWTHPSLEFP